MIGAKVVVFVCVGGETILRGDAACTSVYVYLGSQWEDAKGNQRVCEWGGREGGERDLAENLIYLHEVSFENPVC